MIFLNSIYTFIQNLISAHDEDSFGLIMQLKHEDAINALGKYLACGFRRRKAAEGLGT